MRLELQLDPFQTAYDFIDTLIHVIDAPVYAVQALVLGPLSGPDSDYKRHHDGQRHREKLLESRIQSFSLSDLER